MLNCHRISCSRQYEVISLKDQTNRERAFLFILIQGVASLLSLMLGKLIALYFSPAAFGRYYLIVSAIGLYGMLISSPIVQSFRRHYLGDFKGNLLGVYRKFSLLLPLVLIVFFAILVLVGRMPAKLAILAAIQITITSISSLQLAKINLDGSLLFQSLIQLAQPAVNLLTILYIIFIHYHYEYIDLLIALVLSEFLLLFLTSIRARGLLSDIFKVEDWITYKKRAAELFNYVRPLIALPVFVWLVNNADKYLIQCSFGNTKVGTYSAAYAIGSKLFILVGAAMVSYWNPGVYNKLKDQSNLPIVRVGALERWLWYVGGGLIALFFIWLFQDIIGNVFLAPEYKDGFRLIPILALANLLLVSTYIPEQIFYAIGKTSFVLYHYLVGTVVNIVGNLLLLPIYGLWGSAWVMVISSGIQAGLAILLLFNVQEKGDKIA